MKTAIAVGAFLLGGMVATAISTIVEREANKHYAMHEYGPAATYTVPQSRPSDA